MHYVAKSSNAVLIGVSGTQLDSIVYDSEVAIHGYNLTQAKKKNTKGRGVACHVRSIIVSELRRLFSNIDNIFIDLLFP